MYTIGSLSDLISGAHTPNKLAVKVKEVQYKKPIFKKTNIIKKSNEALDNKAAISKNGKQQLNQIKSEKPFIKSQVNRQAKFNKGKKQSSGNPVRNEGKGRFEKQAPKESIKETSDTIIKNKKINNAEKRKMLKRKASDSETPKNIKKPKVEKKNDLDNSKNDERTIFVGNVPLDTKLPEIKKFFSKYGQVESVRFRGIPTADMKTPKKVALINKQFHPKRTTMLAYVVFKSSEAAIKAKNANGQEFKNFHLRVDYVNDEEEHDKKRSIFLGNLPSDAAEEAVRKLFNVCGKINNIRLVRDRKTNIGKGFGFVNFESPDAVELALQLKNVTVGKREIRIHRCSTPGEKNKKKTADGKKIRERHAVRMNLPKNATETEIRDIFSKCGKILSVRFPPGKEKFCYINFESSAAVTKAVNIKTPTLRKTVLKVNECKPKIKEEQQLFPSIYLSNLPITTKPANLHELFEDCGKVMFVRVFAQKTRQTAVGFVNFETEEALEKALKTKIKIGDREIIISRKTAKKETETKVENLGNEKDEEESDEEVEDESEADEELIRDINGTKKWEDESDSSEADEDEDLENEDDNEDDEDDDNDDDSVDNNEENESEDADSDKAENEAEDESDEKVDNEEDDDESVDSNEENDDDDEED